MHVEAENTKSQIPHQLPPPPPPLPQLQHTSQLSGSSNITGTSKTIKLRTKPSPYIQKLQRAPVADLLESGKAAVEIDLASPVGWYFLYGTLMDPSFLAEVLALSANSQQEMRPAKIVGYTVKLWGQYPALLDGEAGQEVYGMASRICEKKDAVRLAEYETSAYRLVPCLIELISDGDNGVGNDKDRPVRVKGTTLQGFVFKFHCIRGSELQEGNFDLKKWLYSVRR